MLPAGRTAPTTLPAVTSPAPAAPNARRLVVKVTCGAERAEAANQAVTVAATAVAAGVDVSLWLTGEASWWALPGRAEEFALPHAAPRESGT